MDVVTFLSHICNQLPPAAEDSVAEFESSLGVTLPEDYRSFLIACNGGRVGGALWFRGLTPNGDTADVGIDDVGGFRAPNHLSLAWRHECYDGRIPDDLLWIMRDPFGNAICLGVSGESRGKVYFWDHESELEDEWNGSVESAGNIKLLANDFVAFVAHLVPRTDDAYLPLGRTRDG